MIDLLVICSKLENLQERKNMTSYQGRSDEKRKQDNEWREEEEEQLAESK